MSFITAILLGVIQGLTEFFPVSSSAHLKLCKMALGAQDTPLIFDLACHLGTLVALIWCFQKDLKTLLFKERSKLLHFCIALFPLIPSYFLLGPLRRIASGTPFLGYFIMITGAILLLSRFRLKAAKKMRIQDLLLIGTMQSMALIPGISRSATTISCAHMLGWSAKDSVRFSFMLAIPTIVGANLLEVYKLWKNVELSTFLHPYCYVGFAASFLVGMGVVHFAIRWLEKGKWQGCGWYCLLLGSIFNFYQYFAK